MVPVTASPGVGPLGRGERAAAPDLARALLLALIAVANVHLFLVGPGRVGGVRGYPPATGMSGADRAVTFVQALLVDGRAYPLFAALVGYGLVRLGDRVPPTTIRRRGIVLVAVGALHGVVLFSGDIIGAYGLLVLLLAGVAARWTGPALLVLAGPLALVAALLGATQGLGAAEPSLPSIAVSSPVAALADRAGEWPSVTLFSAIVSAAPMLVGMWAARRGVLDDPAAHRVLLRRWAVLGLAGAAVLGLPVALTAAGWWEPPYPVALVGGVVDTLGGYAGALGFLGLVGLVSPRWRPGLLVSAGTWSMTLYLTQSVVFDAVLAGWAGGLGATSGVAAASGFALGVWLVTALVAGLPARWGHRGPPELAVRRLTYGRPPARR